MRTAAIIICVLGVLGICGYAVFILFKDRVSILLKAKVDPKTRTVNFTARNIGSGAPQAHAIVAIHRDLEPPKRILLRVDMPLRDVAKPFEGTIPISALEPIEFLENIILESDNGRNYPLPAENLQELLEDIRERTPCSSPPGV